MRRLEARSENLACRNGGIGRRSPLRGFSMIELTIALTLFAMALAGLFPLLFEYSRQAQHLEKCSPECGRWETTVDGVTKNVTWSYLDRDDRFDFDELPNTKKNQYAYPDSWHLVPSDDPWMWKLGAGAVLVPDDPSELKVDYATSKHTPYLRPFSYVAPTTAGLLTDDSNPANTATVSYGTYSETVSASWIAGPTTGYMGASRRHEKVAAAFWAATWTFKNVQPGWYEVWVTWPSPTADPKPNNPNDNALSTVTYQMLDGDGTPIITVQADQSANPSGRLDGDNWAWTPLQCNVNASYPYWVYIPMRDVAANQLTTTDANGHTVAIYNGDTIKVQIQVPASPAGFVTADAMKLVPKTPNVIKRGTEMVRTWSYDSVNQCPQNTLSATVTVTLKD